MLGNDEKAVAQLKSKATKILNISSVNKAGRGVTANGNSGITGRSDSNSGGGTTNSKSIEQQQKLLAAMNPAERLRASFGIDAKGASVTQPSVGKYSSGNEKVNQNKPKRKKKSTGASQVAKSKK